MDEAESLRIRNAELECELRFTREKLAEAQRGTQYLLEVSKPARRVFPLLSPSLYRFH